MNIAKTAMKVILLTGSTDGIGYEAAKELVARGHLVLIHGRNPAKLQKVETELSALDGSGRVESFAADLSKLSEVEAFARAVLEKHKKLDVLINNAGIFSSPQTRTTDGLDVRFAVNTIAPYLLTKKLLPLIPKYGRVVNLSSAAQAPVHFEKLAGHGHMSDNDAYAQSKLGIAMWSYALSQQHPQTIVAINPASLIGTKMVKEAYGMEGKPITIGRDVICDAALSKKFARSSGKYFDNDSRQFRSPHPDGTNKKKCDQLVLAMDQILEGLGIN